MGSSRCISKDKRLTRFTLLGAWAVLAGCALILTGDVQAQPVSGVADRQAARNFDRTPMPQQHIAPATEGLYSELRRARKDGPRPRAREPYVPYGKFDTPPDASRYNLRQIVVKLKEGSGVQLRSGQLIRPDLADEPSRMRRLERSGLNVAQLRVDLNSLKFAVRSAGGRIGRAAPQVAEEDLTLLHQRAENSTGRELPDPNSFYFIHLPGAVTPSRALALLTSTRKLPSVETAYFQPIPENAQVTDRPPTTTIDVTGAQGYFRPAPTGIDVNILARRPGGDGTGVRIVDIEAGWNDNHEDLPPMSFRFGVNWGAFDADHGTAVLGEIVAGKNAYGATGIAPAAMIGWSSITNLDLLSGGPIYFYSVANALLSSGRFLRPGDIALIEQHFPDSSAGPCPNTCNCGQYGYVAVETMPHEHAVISLFTGGGVIVVEAAGNGQTMVVPASSVDSGAIVVGASDNNLTPACFTNFGPRVNVHAWGQSIGTLGKGESPALRANDDDSTQWYTRIFGGTSGASPIVVGAAALIQSSRMAAGLTPLTPLEMRSLLVTTGTPQAPGTTPLIGPQPDLARAVSGFIGDMARFVSQSGIPLSVNTGATFSLSTQFDNTGAVRWGGAHTMSVAPSFATGWQDFVGPTLTLGTATTPVSPGDRVTGPMPVTAPAQPGTYPFSVQLVSPSGVVLAGSPSTNVVVAQSNTLIDNATMTVDSSPGSLRDGETGSVTVTATNVGTTTWIPGSYLLRIGRGLRISLPQNSNPLTSSVAPGQSQFFTFNVICNGQGQGFFTAQMTEANQGAFGQSASRTIVCQP